MQTCCHWPANIYFFFLASKIGRSLWLLSRLVDWLVGWLFGWLVGDVFVLSWLSSATTIEEGTRKEPNINQQSNLLLVLSRSTAEQAQGSMNWQRINCYFCVCPEHVTQNRNDLTLDSNGKKHQHCFVVLQRIVRGKSKCLPFVVGIPLKSNRANKNIPHFSYSTKRKQKNFF